MIILDNQYKTPVTMDMIHAMSDISKAVDRTCDKYLFQLNTSELRKTITRTCTQRVSRIRRKYKNTVKKVSIICDDTTNPPPVIDDNMLIVDIAIYWVCVSKPNIIRVTIGRSHIPSDVN